MRTPTSAPRMSGEMLIVEAVTNKQNTIVLFGSWERAQHELQQAMVNYPDLFTGKVKKITRDGLEFHDLHLVRIALYSQHPDKFRGCKCVVEFAEGHHVMSEWRPWRDFAVDQEERFRRRV